MSSDPEAPSSSPAQTRVLATVELLELIFQFLDPITLFAIQRVCKRWEGLIADSHRLQEHMFLRVPAHDEKSRPSTRGSTTTVVAKDGAEHYCYENDADDETDEIEPSPITLCPILAPAAQFINTHPNQLAVTCDQTALSGRPSWHNMFLSFPPCKSASAALWWRLAESMRGSVYLESIANKSAADGGLRFSDVIDAALEQRTGKWKKLPDGKLLPLSAAGRDVTLGRFLEAESGGDVRCLEATSVFILSF